MSRQPLNIVILGLSITSSWGNGHATCYRGLMRELTRQGHDVLFLERDVPWYADHRDLPNPPYGRTELYTSFEELRARFTTAVRDADAVIVGSYQVEGVAVGVWVTQLARGVTAFYDIDTPVTLAKLERQDYEYLTPELIPQYDLYLSFTGGPTLTRLEQTYGSPRARALYCSVDPELHYPEPTETRWDLGYLGTYSDDRQPPLKRLMLDPARDWPAGRFCVAGPNYPASIAWPKNVQRIDHLPPDKHRAFYSAQQFTLNVTRADMVRAGYSPSVRLFEAAACGTPIISDQWAGLDTLFEPGREILITHSAAQTLNYLQTVDETQRRKLAERARERLLREHTAGHRAAELVGHIHEAREQTGKRRPRHMTIG